MDQEFITEREVKVIGRCNIKVEMVSLKFLVWALKTLSGKCAGQEWREINSIHL